jgi:PDZ domain-containing protein
MYQSTDDAAPSNPGENEDSVENSAGTSGPSIWNRALPKRYAVLGFTLLFLAILTHWLLSPSPYYRAVPGPVISLSHQISTANVKNLSYVTVEVNEINWIQYLWYSHVDHSQNIISARDLGTNADAIDQNYEMAQAKASAIVLANYLVSGHYDAVPTGSVVESILSNSPAHKAGFELGDIIVSVDGKPTTTPAALVARTVASNGQLLRFGVLRYGKRITLSATPKKVSGKYRVGVDISPYDTLLPPKNSPTINTSGVAGPSGGLMFTLATLNALVPGDLSGPRRVAGTGTISAQPGSLGQVGPIGDVALKVQGAINAGNQVFFVDPYDYGAAKAAAGTSITVVPVATVYEALRWLCYNGATDKLCSDLTQIDKRLSTNPS